MATARQRMQTVCPAARLSRPRRSPLGGPCLTMGGAPARSPSPPASPASPRTRAAPGRGTKPMKRRPGAAGSGPTARGMPRSSRTPSAPTSSSSATAVAGGADDRIRLHTPAAVELDSGLVQRLDAAHDLDPTLALIASMTSLSTIAGATPSRYMRENTPSSGTGSPYSLRSPTSMRRPKRATGPRSGSGSSAGPRRSCRRGAARAWRIRMFGGVRADSQTFSAPPSARS